MSSWLSKDVWKTIELIRIVISGKSHFSYLLVMWIKWKNF
jgi:hypothetical protein